MDHLKLNIVRSNPILGFPLNNHTLRKKNYSLCRAFYEVSIALWLCYFSWSVIYSYIYVHIVHESSLYIFPSFTAEAERIRKCRGRVFALQDEPEVSRVWLPNNDSPGLAMARAFGDFCLKDFGLISVPEVSYRRLTEKDEFVVLATDGVGYIT